MEFDVWKQLKPLAIGIEKDIFRLVSDEQVAGASKKVVQKVLYRHTSRMAYRTNLTKGGERYHLNGTASGEVTQHQQTLATKQLSQ